MQDCNFYVHPLPDATRTLFRHWQLMLVYFEEELGPSALNCVAHLKLECGLLATKRHEHLKVDTTSEF